MQRQRQVRNEKESPFVTEHPRPLYMKPALRWTVISPLFTSTVRSSRLAFTVLPARSFSHTIPRFEMSELKVDLTAPNGRKITLPTGLFINNEFVKATGGQTITSISPA